jgi:hypothetical protein
MYRRVQTGPKTQLGGFQSGFTSVGYHVRTFAAVASPPIALAANDASSSNPRASHARGRLGWAAGMDVAVGEGVLIGCGG